MCFFFFFFFNDTATTEIYTLSLHDALPIAGWCGTWTCRSRSSAPPPSGDRKSTRLNSSQGYISYAVFCLKKKKTQTKERHLPPVTTGRTHYQTQYKGP